MLSAQGIEARPAVVGPPASSQEIAEVEEALDLALPVSFASTLQTVSKSVRWSWTALEGRAFPEPFGDIFSGGVEWSLSGLVQTHESYLDWVRMCFSDDRAGASVWQHKIGLTPVGNGDLLAVDRAPDAAGAIVYLSHEAGEGHGYHLASSLDDLLERWVPLACPGPEDVQWLPFVPYDLGPIDPSCANGRRWRSLLGLAAAPPRTVPSRPDDALFTALVASEDGAEPSRAQVLRALKVCSPARADEVLRLLRSDDPFVQEAAARRLGAWRLQEAVEELTGVAVDGTHNGRIAAVVALRGIPGPAAERALAELRDVLGPEWSMYLGPSPDPRRPPG